MVRVPRRIVEERTRDVCERSRMIGDGEEGWMVFLWMGKRREKRKWTTTNG
jgi:hypothetical protein